VKIRAVVRPSVLASNLLTYHAHVSRAISVLLVVLTLAGALPVQAQNRPANIQDLSLEDLLAIEVTSVSRKEQTLGQTAAPIFVITADEIRRSGATTLPDLLRLVPGVFVGQVNANTWSIASRGFASLYSNKLLVLVDGMSLYDPTSGGVTWEWGRRSTVRSADPMPVGLTSPHARPHPKAASADKASANGTIVLSHIAAMNRDRDVSLVRSSRRFSAIVPMTSR